MTAIAYVAESANRGLCSVSRTRTSLVDAMNAALLGSPPFLWTPRVVMCTDGIVSPYAFSAVSFPDLVVAAAGGGTPPAAVLVGDDASAGTCSLLTWAAFLALLTINGPHYFGRAFFGAHYRGAPYYV